MDGHYQCELSTRYYLLCLLSAMMLMVVAALEAEELRLERRLDV